MKRVIKKIRHSSERDRWEEDLVHVIDELNSRIESLETKVAALELLHP